jgi:hypothetical protein
MTTIPVQPTYNYIQTFYVNAEAVDNSPEVMLTSVVLYFKSKPARLAAGTTPSVNIALCPVVNGQPVPENLIPGTTVRMVWDNINASSNSLDGTFFAFDNPVSIKTNQSYGIMIATELDAYELWQNVQGQRLISSTGTVTDTPSPGASANLNGKLYKSTLSTSPSNVVNNTQSSNLTAYNSYLDRDLKFKVNIAKFDMTNKSKTITLTSKNYEFFTITARNGIFSGGEWIYLNQANEAGTIKVDANSKTIIGSGTNFATTLIGKKIIFTIDNVTDVLRITGINSATEMEVESFPRKSSNAASFKIPPVGKLYTQNNLNNSMVLVDSNASDAVFKFAAGSSIIGAFSGSTATIVSIDKHSVDSFTPRFKLGNPAFSTTNISYKFSTEASQIYSSFNNLVTDKLNEVKNYDAYIYSRSFEVSQPEGTFGLGINKKSGIAQVAFNYTTDKNYSYIAPYIDGDQLDVYTQQNSINADTNITKTRTITSSPAVDVSYQFDSETTRFGTAKSKYLSKKISFAADRAAEDIVVYMSAYVPQDTEVRVYAKLHNGLDKEAFDDKTWTPLQLKSTFIPSDPADSNDVRELEYNLPFFHPEVETLLSSFAVATVDDNATANVAGGDISQYLVAGDIVKIYDPNNEAQNYDIFQIASTTSSSITLNRKILDPNITGTMAIKLIKYPNAAFKSYLTDGVARYISSGGVQFDKFNAMQVKVVLLSNSTYVVPSVESIQVLGVSA